MKRTLWLCIAVVSCVLSGLAQQQQTGASAGGVSVPHVMKFGGVVTDANGKPSSGIVGVTFSLYKDSQGGAPLWMETQNVQPDKGGHYNVELGSASSQGLPTDLFSSGEARWLGAQVQAQAEQPRVMLVSVPYALKALDAQTLDGKPASAFIVAPTSGSNSVSSTKNPGSALPTLGGTGTPNHITKWITSSTIGNSGIFETPTGNVGIGTTTPATKFDLKGTGAIRDTLTLFPSGVHPTLSISGTVFSVSSTGKVTFVAGQTFPGTGTVTSVGSGAGLTGGPITHSGTLSIKNAGVTNAMLQNSSLTVNPGTDLTGGGSVALGGTITLNVDTTKVPQLNGNNSFTGNQAISGNVGATGTVSASAVSGSAPSGHAVAEFSGSADTIVIVTQTGSGDAIDVYNSGSAGIAVVGTGPTSGGISAINSSAATTLYAENDDTFSSDFLVFETNSTSFQGQCAIDLAGNFGCTGTKSAVVPVSGQRKVALYAVEAPENWFEDFGSNRLSGGAATILLEPTFAETVNTALEYHVFLTPKGDCKGLFVSNERASSFEVHEMGGGTSNVAFDYRIVAKRKAYESIRLADMTKKFQKPNVARPKAVK